MRRLVTLALLLAFSPIVTNHVAGGESPGPKAVASLAKQHIDNEATGDEFSRRHP